jgi:hypothetical protein
MGIVLVVSHMTQVVVSPLACGSTPLRQILHRGPCRIEGEIITSIESLASITAARWLTNGIRLRFLVMPVMKIPRAKVTNTTALFTTIMVIGPVKENCFTNLCCVGRGMRRRLWRPLYRAC